MERLPTLMPHCKLFNCFCHQFWGERPGHLWQVGLFSLATHAARYFVAEILLSPFTAAASFGKEVYEEATLAAQRKALKTRNVKPAKFGWNKAGDVWKQATYFTAHQFMYTPEKLREMRQQ